MGITERSRLRLCRRLRVRVTCVTLYRAVIHSNTGGTERLIGSADSAFAVE